MAVLAVRKFEVEWLGYIDKNYAEVAHNIRTAKLISPEDEKRMHEAVKAFKAQFKA